MQCYAAPGVNTALADEILLCVCMCVWCVCVYVCICVCVVCVCVCGVCICVCVCVCVCMYVCVCCVCIYVCALYMYVCMCVCVLCVCVFGLWEFSPCFKNLYHAHTHTHIYSSILIYLHKALFLKSPPWAVGFFKNSVYMYRLLSWKPYDRY